jgi:hypothetical protein
MWFALILAVAPFVVAAVVLAYVLADRIAYHNFRATLTEKERQQFDGFLAVNTDWRMFARMTADERDAAVKVKVKVKVKEKRPPPAGFRSLRRQASASTTLIGFHFRCLRSQSSSR